MALATHVVVYQGYVCRSTAEVVDIVEPPAQDKPDGVCVRAQDRKPVQSNLEPKVDVQK